MRYEPYDYEYAAIPEMSNAQLIDYFLSRIYETEEVWGLKEGGKYWFTYENNGKERMPVFPYKLFSEEACVSDWEVLIPVAESLEFFMEQTLPRLIQQGVDLEILPKEPGKGVIVTSVQLENILAHMIENGTYTLEG